MLLHVKVGRYVNALMVELLVQRINTASLNSATVMMMQIKYVALATYVGVQKWLPLQIHVCASRPMIPLMILLLTRLQPVLLLLKPMIVRNGNIVSALTVLVIASLNSASLVIMYVEMSHNVNVYKRVNLPTTASANHLFIQLCHLQAALQLQKLLSVEAGENVAALTTQIIVPDKSNIANLTHVTPILLFRIVDKTYYVNVRLDLHHVTVSHQVSVIYYTFS